MDVLQTGLEGFYMLH